MLGITIKATRTKSRLRPIAALAIASLAAVNLVAVGTASAAGGSSLSGNLTWWSWTPTPQLAAQYIAAFNKQYPRIKVTYKLEQEADWDVALRPALQSSDGPDIFEITPGAKMSEYSGDATNLTSAMVKALGPGWKSKMAAGGVQQLSTSSGQLAGVSAGSVDAGSLWINENLFQKYRVSPPKTFQAWVNDCAIFKKNGVTCFTQGTNSSSAPFSRDELQSLSNAVKPGVWTAASKGTTKWTNPTIVKALTYWKQMASNGILESGALGLQQVPDALNAFMSGKAAMIQMGTWQAQYVTVSGMTAAMSAAGVGSPKAFPIIPIPYPALTGPGSLTKYNLYGDSDYGFAVNRKSKNQAAATAFVVWLGTSKVAQQLVANGLNDVPALKGITPNWNALKMVNKAEQLGPVQNLLTQATKVTETRNALLSDNLITAIGVAASTVESGTSPASAAKTLQQAAESSSPS
jgi:raffinose/stachyose/melibiose transport system substrate-binding protein